MLIIGMMLAVTLGAFQLANWRYTFKYPYGRSRNHVKQLLIALHHYAETHDGHYPAGQQSPAASFSLLHYHKPFVDADALRGKSVEQEVVQAIFDQNGLLTPATCGWHYTAGLTQNDDWRLALFWNKAGLGHAGERLSNGGHEVFLVGNQAAWVPESEWPSFLKEQELLLANRDQAAVNGEPVLTTQVKLPNGETVDQFAGNFKLTVTQHVELGANRSYVTGDKFHLAWKGTRLEWNGELDLALVFPDLGLRSKPMKLNVINHRPATNPVVFELEKND